MKSKSIAISIILPLTLLLWGGINIARSQAFEIYSYTDDDTTGSFNGAIGPNPYSAPFVINQSGYLGSGVFRAEAPSGNFWTMTLHDITNPLATSTVAAFVQNEGGNVNDDYFVPYNPPSEPSGRGILVCGSDCFITAGHTYIFQFSAVNTVNPYRYRYNSSTGLFYAILLSDDSLDTSTHFIQPYSPASGTASNASTVTFSADYYFNCVDSFDLYDRVSFDINAYNNSTGNSYAVAAPSFAINQCGGDTVEFQYLVDQGTDYLWRPIMFSSTSTSSPLYGSTYIYFASSTPPFTPIGSTNASSTLPGEFSLLQYINIPALLQTRVPFAYMFLARNAFSTITGSTTPAIFPTGSFQVNIAGSTTTINMFSTSTVSYFLTPAVVNPLRGLMVAVIYFSGLLFFYRWGISHHHFK